MLNSAVVVVKQWNSRGGRTMQQFDNVLKELKTWLMSIPIVNKLIPYALYIMIGGLGCSLLYELIGIFDYFSIFDIVSEIGYYGFLLGFWLVLISNEIRWAPYGLFGKAFVLLFPFTDFYLSTIIDAGIYIYFGYHLVKYTALQAKSH